MKVSELPYRRIPIEEQLAALARLTDEASQADSADTLIRVRTRFVECIKHFSTMLSLSHTHFTQDSRNPDYAAEKDYYDETAPQAAAAEAKFKRAFLDNPHRKEAETKMNPLVLRRYELQLKCMDEKIVPDLIEENKLTTRYAKLMSETLFPFRGERLPLPALRKYFSDPDRTVRKQAYDAAGKTLATIADQLDEIYDSLVKVRDAMAKKLGYENYVGMGDDRMEHSLSYSRAMLRAFRENVLRDVVPAVAALKTELGQSLGAHPFMLYDNDVYFAQGNPSPVLSGSGMFEAGRAMYRAMSKETGEFFDMMEKNEAFDVLPRAGKWGGGYCTSFADFKQPFILANFNGTSGDVDVLTHEAGHAFADYMMYRQNHDFELNVGGMETAETHSMSMEFFCWPFIDTFFGKRGEDYKFMHLFDSFAFLPYGTMVDNFQEIVYANPDLTPKQRNDLWLSLEQKFRPYLRTDGITYLEQGTRWQYQMHIYENPFYYVEYCLAQSVALQFLFASRKNYDAAFSAYTTFLKQGGEKEFPALIAEANLQSPFTEGALLPIAEKVRELTRRLRR